MKLFDFQLKEPAWIRCTRCGTYSAAAVCYDCMRGADRHREQRESTAYPPFPARFGWATFARRELLTQRLATAEYPSWSGRVVQKCFDAVDASAVVLTGRSGAGKTSLAVAMAVEWQRRRQRRAYWADAEDYAAGAFDLDDDIRYAPLVILDDVGGERDLKSNLVPAIITARHKHNFPLWITTWLTLPEAITRYGEGVGRRIFHQDVVHIDVAPPVLRAVKSK